MNKSPHTKVHTFASHTCLCTDQSLQKSVLFADLRRNSIYFLPSHRCFNFFATHNRPDKTVKLTADKDFNNLTDRTPAGNNTYKKLAVQWLNEALCFVSSSVVADSLVLLNRQLFVAANRYGQV